jgi:tetratricopeptide (TPR) repeat protein
MKLKTTLAAFIAFGLIVAFSVTSQAQTGGIEGDVWAIQADGSKLPAVNVLIELYRTDVKGRYETKTDKKGHFAHIGLPFGMYAILVSGSGFEPTFDWNVRIRGDQVKRDYELRPGDGRRLTLDDVQKAMAQRGQGGQAAPQLTAEQKKQLEEQEKQIAEQKKRAAKDEEMIKEFNAANQLASAGSYQDAITSYQKALEMSPDHPQLYVILGKMAESYHNLGVERFNAKERASAGEAFSLAIETSKKAIAQIPETKADQRPNYQSLLCRSLAVLATYIDQTKVADAIAAHQALMEMQPTPADKARTQSAVAKIFLDTNKSDEAIAAYKKTLEIDPNNLDALFGLGQALIQPGDPAKYTEAMTTLKSFVDKAKNDQQRAAQVQQANEMITAVGMVIEQDKTKKKKP